MDLDNGHHSHLKIGSYDSDTLISGNSLNFVNTVTDSSWGIEAEIIELSEKDVIDETRLI